MEPLTHETHTQIQLLCNDGDILAEKRQFAQALDKYWAAFDLIPEPKTNREATTWVLVAIGDANFLNNDFQAGVDNLSNAMHCPGAIGNPFIHLRLGQCQLETGNTARAADELTRAYAVAGEDIFSNEDPKYLAFLKTQIETEEAGTPAKKPWWKF